ncbi:MAG: hypothetical protein AAGC55_21030, partial [Myxococcota bacterium]
MSDAHQGIPLSPAQRALVCHRPDDAAMRRARIRLRLDTAVDRGQFERAVLTALTRHEVLRTRIVTVDGLAEPVQIIDPEPDKALPPSVLSDVPPHSGSGNGAVTPDASQAGPAGASTALRAHLWHTEDGTAQLELDLPWLLADRRTLELMAAELVASCRAGNGASELSDDA